MALYKKKKGGDTWHWCRNCAKYPSGDVETTTTRPAWDLCEECKAKERNGNCTT